MGYRHDDEDACQLCLTDDATILLNHPDWDAEYWPMACDNCSVLVDDLEAQGLDWNDAVRSVAGFQSGAEPF